MMPTLTISVVSHGQNELTNLFLRDLREHCSGCAIVLVTLNAADPIELSLQPELVPTEIIVNQRPKGFGANHNAAFLRCRTPFFCVANPDIRLVSNPFPTLLSSLGDERVGVAGPLVRNPAGDIEDSARRFPTLGTLLRKAISHRDQHDYPVNHGAIEVDWIAGMFMLFRTATYREAGGFDERYFLYYEDVDLCRRLHAAGKKAIFDPRTEVIHDARRASRKQLRYAMHHLSSALRFSCSQRLTGPRRESGRAPK